MESASPSSSGKMMPSGGKGGKPASMSGLVRANLPTQQTTSQHPGYYNGGKGNPAAGGYPDGDGRAGGGRAALRKFP